MATAASESRPISEVTGPRYPMYLAGEWVESDTPLEVVNPYDGSLIGTTFQASAAQLDQAITAAQKAFAVTRKLPTHDRVTFLKAIAAGLRERRDEAVRMICLEAGKPVRESEVEVDRGVFTLETAAEEAKRIEGEVIPLDLLPSSKGRF
ncbi:MAG: aldehyde dehydrogenase family protein, partial [Chloroflexota bacterium]|nr:aldehyde dehydrogenase family protein [Chloroflexota bacterium]